MATSILLPAITVNIAPNEIANAEVAKAVYIIALPNSGFLSKKLFRPVITLVSFSINQVYKGSRLLPIVASRLVKLVSITFCW